MNRENERQISDPVDQVSFGRLELLQIREKQRLERILKARKVSSLPEGEERDRLVSNIRIRLEEGDSVGNASVGPGSGERHTRQSTPHSETIL